MDWTTLGAFLVAYPGQMAIIRSLVAGDGNARENLTEVDCKYQVVDSGSRGALIHLATYGSDSRQSEPKVSQVIQIDQNIAWQLVDLIMRTYRWPSPVSGESGSGGFQAADPMGTEKST